MLIFGIVVSFMGFVSCCIGLGYIAQVFEDEYFNRH